MLIVFVIILALLFTLMVLPISIILDSDEQQLKIRYGGILSLQLIFKDFTVTSYLTTPFKTYTLKKTVRKEKKEKTIKKKKKKKAKFNFWKLQLILSETKKYSKRILKSFSLKEARINLDTGDYPLNAMLIPIMATISKGNTIAAINFVGYNSIYCELRNRFIYIIFPTFIYFIKLFIIIIRR